MNSTYKIYNDGSHYVGTLIMPKRKSDIKCKRIDTVYDYLFDYLYLDSLDKGYKRTAQHNYIVGEFIKHYPDYGADGADKFVAHKLEKKIANLHSRFRRFKRKSHMNNWNYMVTITLDGKKHNDDSFRRKLKKCFANFHTRRGWNFMGAFERSPEKKRLHFHGMLYIPPGEEVGELLEKFDYSTKKKCMQRTVENTFFSKAFGRNDFQEIDETDLVMSDMMDYILKYIAKGGESIFYSRGIREFLMKKLNAATDIAATIMGFVERYVFYDDVIYSWGDEEQCKDDIGQNT